MKPSPRIVLMMLATLFASAAAFSQSSHPNWDAEAVEVIKQMDAYLESMQEFVVTTESYTDSEITGRMIISSPSVAKVSVDRSGSLHSVARDEKQTSEIFIHDGELIVFTDEHNYYTRTDIPDDLSEALEFALEEFDVETPALDLLLVDSLDHLVTDQVFVIYVTDSSWIRGVECHHIVLSGPTSDLQLWVENGDNAAPRRTVLTNKTKQVRPRHEVFMDWQATDDLNSSDFEFSPPDGAREIGFIDVP